MMVLSTARVLGKSVGGVGERGGGVGERVILLLGAIAVGSGGLFDVGEIWEMVGD
jgi:hypothetical protein